MHTIEALRAARALIDTPEKWTRDAFARNAAGDRVAYSSEAAVCFCAEGAIGHAIGRMYGNDFRDVADALVAEIPSEIVGEAESDDNSVIPAFNDNEFTTHADVLAAFDRAIAACEG